MGLVYSTDGGRLHPCPRCGRPLREDEACGCPGSSGGSADGIVRVRREISGRKGKTVTTVHGVPGNDTALKALAGELKRLCGSGGTVTAEGAIEVQGDHRERVIAHLESRGYRVRAAGG